MTLLGGAFAGALVHSDVELSAYIVEAKIPLLIKTVIQAGQMTERSDAKPTLVAGWAGRSHVKGQQTVP